MPVANRYCDLLAPGALQRWKVNAPEMAVSVPRKRLQDAARGDTMGDTSLDYLFGSHVANQTPDRPHQSGIAVVPRLKALGAGTNSFCFQFSYHVRPQSPKLGSLLARPGDAERFMQVFFPVVIGFVSIVRSFSFAHSSVLILDRHPDLEWICGHGGGHRCGMFQEIT